MDPNGRISYLNATTDMIIDLDFKDCVAFLDLDSLEKSNDVVCILDNNMFLKGYNSAWENFARQNNGEDILVRFPLGVNIGTVGEEPLKSYLIQGYRRALQENILFQQDYECSSAEEFRLFRQFAYPLIDSKGLLISHHLIVTKPHDQKEYAFSRQFVNDKGFIVQCQNCRKIRDPKSSQSWYWVPFLVKNPHPNISHDICIPCIDHYFPDITF